MPKIRCTKTGLIYRNPRPHLKSVHAYFPSVVRLSDTEYVATLALGEAFESTDLRSWTTRSTDGGDTWELEAPLYPGTEDRLTTDCCRISRMPDGSLAAFMVRANRDAHPNHGFANPDNLGFVPTELLLLRSQDGGRSWSEPVQIIPPLVGPEFELCAPITPVADHRLLLPTSTWRGWDGTCPNGMKMVAFISEDGGVTWPEYADVMSDVESGIIYWESKIVRLSDRLLLAVAWAYDERNNADIPNQYALSSDNGSTWTQPQSTGLQGQTMTPTVLADGRVLCLYRRMDKTGLWATVASVSEAGWENQESEPLWGYQASSENAEKRGMVESFQTLRFGAPCALTEPDGSVFAAFWAYEDCVCNIRWFRIAVD